MVSEEVHLSARDHFVGIDKMVPNNDSPFLRCISLIELSELLRLFNPKIAANFYGQKIADFIVSRQGTTSIRAYVTPPRMTSAFTNERATIAARCDSKLRRFIPLQTAIDNSSKPLPAALRASARLNSIASINVSRSDFNKVSRVSSWQLTPGTSSIQPIQKLESCLITAV